MIVVVVVDATNTVSVLDDIYDVFADTDDAINLLYSL